VSGALFGGTATAPGLFVTVDGPNGSGKTSLIDAVSARLAAERLVYCTRQPSPTTLGQMIRSSEREFRGRALACLIAGDRHHQLETEIVPRLNDGAVVLCDRYIESSLVLQRLDGVTIDEILAINSGILRPDLRIRLLAQPDILRARLDSRPTDASRRFERAPDAPERELALYQDADRLLTDDYDLPATVYDTSMTHATELAERVAFTITAHLAKQR
jgi:dTMP kinase